MKLIPIIILMIFFLMNCSNAREKKIVKITHETLDSVELPNNSVKLSELNYNPKSSLWTLNGKRFTGYAFSLYPDKILKKKIGIFDGKKQNQSLDYFPDGHLQFLANYHHGKLHGEKKSWSPDAAHILVSHLNYYLGKADGVQKKWYPTGEIFQILHLEMGREKGTQQAFRKNGDLYANYEAREGRIFGLKRTALCYGLENEKIQYENQ